MRITSLDLLPPPVRGRLLRAMEQDGLSAAFTDAAELEQYLAGPVFEDGRTCLVVMDGDVPAGVLGVVVREIATRGEVFLTQLQIFADDVDAALAPLLRAAYRVARDAGADAGTAFTAGVAANRDPLVATLERLGFRAAYRMLDMVRDAAVDLPFSAALEFRPLTRENLADYLTVENAAFLTSPNGAQVTAEEIEEARRAARAPAFMQLGLVDGAPAAVLEVDVRGDVGQIQTVAVAPGMQGRGLGRTALARAMKTVEAAGARMVHLQVMDSNAPAVALYRSCGFQLDHVVSTWYRGPALGARRV